MIFYQLYLFHLTLKVCIKSHNSSRRDGTILNFPVARHKDNALYLLSVFIGKQEYKKLPTSPDGCSSPTLWNET